MFLLDSLAVIICLLTGLWIFGQLHRYGFRGLPALITTLGMLWVAASTLSALASTVGRGLGVLLSAAGGPFGGPVLFGLAVLIAVALRWWWADRQARRSFNL